MKKIAVVLLAALMIMLSGCDPIYPLGNIRVSAIPNMSIGSSYTVEIIYPHIGGSVVSDWKEQKIEETDGDILEISGMVITAKAAGTAKIKISAVTVIVDELKAEGFEERCYVTEATVRVKE